MLTNYAQSHSYRPDTSRSTVKSVALKHADAVKNIVQAKYKIGQSNDQYEQEADRIAEQVMGMPEPHQTSSVADTPPQNNFTSVNGIIQRRCKSCEEEQELIQKKSTDNTTTEVAPAINTGVQSLTGGGQPMSFSERGFFEPRFGEDFSDVRVHSGVQAATVARAINARAFTLGNNVVFGQGEYVPGSYEGKKLFAHELTHVIQQKDTLSRKSPAVKINAPPQADIIQRTDARFESGSGVDNAITAGTMTADGIMGTTITANNCRGLFGCNVGFKFSKAYKGTYTYRSAGRDVKGVYVKIESEYEHDKCGSCDQIRLIQTVRSITRGSSGSIETADPGSATRRERSGWGDASAPSRGWRVDRLSSGATSTNPFYDVSAGFDSQIGSPTQPAILWDAPGDWSTTTNAGKEFETFFVCETTGAANRITIAGVNWGYLINGSGAISFRPATPTASCGASQVLEHAVTRWEGIAGNQAANIDFSGETAVNHEGTRSLLWFEYNSTNLRNDSAINSNTHYTIANRRIRQHILATMPFTQIIIHGYSSTDGAPGPNMTLSENRARSIRERLIREGIPATMLVIQAHGESSDLSPADMNRRVEIETTIFRGPVLPPHLQPAPGP